jgi:flagellar basal-body rod protein FlgB
MSIFSSLDTLQGYVNVVTDRQQMVVSNMANVDTPGYQTKDFNFQTAVREAMNSEGSAHFEPASMELIGLPERPDGNNVNIDRESMLLSQTQLQYKMGVQLEQSELHTLYSAIKDEN